MAVLRLYYLISLSPVEWGVTWSTHLFTCHCLHGDHLLYRWQAMRRLASRRLRGRLEQPELVPRRIAKCGVHSVPALTGIASELDPLRLERRGCREAIVRRKHERAQHALRHCRCDGLRCGLVHGVPRLRECDRKVGLLGRCDGKPSVVTVFQIFSNLKSEFLEERQRFVLIADPEGRVSDPQAHGNTPGRRL